MKWLDKLERKFGKYYINNLMLKVIFISSIAYFISYFILQDFSFLNGFVLIPSRVLKGEVWRLISFVFIPPLTTSIILVAINYYFQYFIAVNLERQWGEFKFNVYFFIGVLSTIVLSFITGQASTSAYITTSLFLAFAKIYPDMRILLFFIIPIKVKWIGYITWASTIINIVLQLFTGNIKGAILSLVPLMNYLLFFGVSNYKETKMNAQAKVRKREYNKAFKGEVKQYRHKCTVCGITDLDDKNMIFRYCSKCGGEHAYCEKHIKDHIHIK